MRRLILILMILAVVLPQAPTIAADEDWDIPNGHFFTQTGGGGDKGYAVTDEDGAKFWNEFQRFGGVQAVGYPVSGRFSWSGFTVQAFQRVVFQWRSEVQQAYFVNVFDLLSEQKKDEWLLSVRQTPKPVQWSESGLDWSEIVRRRLAVMDAFPAIKKVYESVSGDPVTTNGLPVAEVADMGTAYVLRAQRIVIQQWKEDVPWAAKGQVTVANGGDIGKEVGLYPAAATSAQAAQFDRNGNPVQGSAPAAQQPVASSPLGKITFTSNRESWDDVFIMNADGSDQKQLTNRGRSYAGALSPDGFLVAYDSATSADKRRNYQIYTMKADGSDVKRLTNNNSEDWYPTWSADGKRIAFFSLRDGGWGIWVMNADGSDQRKLVSSAVARPPTGAVAWSSSGAIAWSNDDLKIFVVNADGSGRRELIGRFSAFPAWSPDGGRIAFAKYERLGGVFQIWVANADGGGAVMLTSRAQNFWPAWSPDGTKLAFASYRDGNWEVYVMNADGSKQVNLTKSAGDDKAPFWSK